MKSTITKLSLLVFLLNICIVGQKKSGSDSPPKPEVIFHNLSNERVPLFAFTYISPWRVVYGSDSPEFVLYQDGTVFFTKCLEVDNPYSCDFAMAKLSSQEIAQMMEKLQLKEFYSLEDRYSPNSTRVGVTDLTTRVFVMRKPDGTYKEVSTYGDLTGNKEGYVASNVPTALTEIVQFVMTYDNKNTIPFRFEYIEVEIEPSNEDSTKKIVWTRGLPDLNDSKTIAHKKYGRYSLFVSQQFHDKVQKIKYKAWKSEAAILINNRKWKAETRIPFPSESIWLGNFRD